MAGEGELEQATSDISQVKYPFHIEAVVGLV
jgi:hypothetical protein